MISIDEKKTCIMWLEVDSGFIARFNIISNLKLLIKMAEVILLLTIFLENARAAKI